MNLPSCIVLGVLVVVVGIILFFLFKNKGKGCSCCNNKTCPKCKNK